MGYNPTTLKFYNIKNIIINNTCPRPCPVRTAMAVGMAVPCWAAITPAAAVVRGARGAAVRVLRIIITRMV
jgi:hypothetical protein